MQICEDSSSSSMDFCDADVKIEEVEEDYEDQFVIHQENSSKMIFTSLYVPSESSDMMITSSTLDFKNRPGRKQKLEHLSYEEKVMRKKLKNREAAQTSRDRKKARMEELERQVRYLQQQNERLRSEKEDISKENNRLKEELVQSKVSPPSSHRLTCPVVPPPSHLPTNTALSPHRSTPADATSCSLSTPADTSLQSAHVDTQKLAERQVKVRRESAEFLDSSLQKTSGLTQACPLSMPSALEHALTVEYPVTLTQEVRAMVSIISSVVLLVVMGRTCSQEEIGTGSLILKKAHLQSAFSSLSSSQQNYLNQLLFKIAKELNQIPQWWGPQQQAWNSVNFLHTHIPLFLKYLPRAPLLSAKSPPEALAALPPLSTLVATSMKTLPVQ